MKIKISSSPHPYYLQQHLITIIISHPRGHHDITIIPYLSSTETPYHPDYIPLTRPSIYHYYPPSLIIYSTHHITMTIIPPTPTIDYITIIPHPYHLQQHGSTPYNHDHIPTHTTINISPSSPSLSSTATTYHHDHIPPTRP